MSNEVDATPGRSSATSAIADVSKEAYASAEADLFEQMDSDPDLLFDDEHPIPPDEPEGDAPLTDGDEPEEGDESEPEEEVGDDPEDSEDDTEEQPEEDEDDQPTDDEDGSGDGEVDDDEIWHTLVIDGEEYEVTRAEAIKGYLRESDYTQKRQADAATQREAMAGVQAQRDEYGERLEVLDAAIRQFSPTEKTPEEWDTLRRQNPDQFARDFSNHQLVKQQLDAVNAEKGRIQQEKLGLMEEQLREHLEGEKNALLSAIPEWQDEAVADAERQEMHSFAMSYGFSESDLAQVSDHRLMLLLRDGMKYRQGKTKGEAAIREKVDTAIRLKPGTGKKKSRKKQSIRKKQRNAERMLARTGTEKDALAAILDLVEL